MSDQLQFLHSTYSKHKKQDGTWTDALILCAKDIETGESKLITHIDPKRLMYTVKEPLRKEFSMMKEAHHLRDLDGKYVHNHSLEYELANSLHMNSRGYIHPAKVLSSPYSAGNDIPIDVLYKHDMNEKLPRTAARYRVGGFDIETDIVNGTNAILCVSYVSDDHEVYLGILRHFLKGKEDLDVINACCEEKVAEFCKNLNPKAQKVMEQYPIKGFNIKLCDTEMELLKWVWSKVHKKKDDVMSIWNMIFDMRTMLDRCNFYHVNPANIMCHPEASTQYRVCELKEDKTPIEKLGHHTYRWDFMHLSGYTQPVDSMCLFSRLRKVKGLKSNYTLGSIASETIGSSKMDFGEDGHYTMQTERQVEYCAYNVIDSLILTVHDKVTNDVSSMFLLTQNTILPAFSKQTVQLTHSFFKYLKNRDMVPGSCQGDLSLTMEKSTGEILPYSSWLKKFPHPKQLTDAFYAGEYINVDKEILNVGGGVLNPLLSFGTGVPIIEEFDDEVNVAMAVSDLDVASEYPNVTIKINCSKGTKRATAIKIRGMEKTAINDFFGHYGATYENAVYLCNEYFGLPNYEEMARLATEQVKGFNANNIFEPKRPD